MTKRNKCYNFPVTSLFDIGKQKLRTKWIAYIFLYHCFNLGFTYGTFSQDGETKLTKPEAHLLSTPTISFTIVVFIYNVYKDYFKQLSIHYFKI